MKKITFLSLLLIFTFEFSTQAQGIQFTKGSWKETLAKAKAANKLVFVDVYTEWCGPCKWMVKNVFPDASVGKKFNSSFINYQIDAEEGEGVELAQKYMIDGYPSLLFVDGSGKLVHKALGAHPAPELLKEANKALRKKKS